MTIRLSAGTASGTTEATAYEAAMQAAGHEPRSCEAQSSMTQLRVGCWAHAALGMLCDEHSGSAFFIELQDENLERLQRALYAAALSKRSQSDVPLSVLQATFASVVCRGQPVCAVVLAMRVEPAEIS